MVTMLMVKIVKYLLFLKEWADILETLYVALGTLVLPNLFK